MATWAKQQTVVGAYQLRNYVFLFLFSGSHCPVNSIRHQSLFLSLYRFFIPSYSKSPCDLWGNILIRMQMRARISIMIGHSFAMRGKLLLALCGDKWPRNIMGHNTERLLSFASHGHGQRMVDGINRFNYFLVLWESNSEKSGRSTRKQLIP